MLQYIGRQLAAEKGRHIGDGARGGALAALTLDLQHGRLIGQLAGEDDGHAAADAQLTEALTEGAGQRAVVAVR